jgi:hypothetical protein
MITPNRLNTLVIFFLVLFTAFSAPADENKCIYGIWYLPSGVNTVNGLTLTCLGCLDNGRCVSNGIRLELPGFGFLLPLAPSPRVDSEDAYADLVSRPAEKVITGLNVSLTGTVTEGDIRGISIGGLDQQSIRAYGIFGALLANNAVDLRGIQVAVFDNNAGRVRGLQLGIVQNRSFSLQGLQIGAYNSCTGGKGGLQIGLVNRRGTTGCQIGLLNINQLRIMPFFNW